MKIRLLTLLGLGLAIGLQARAQAPDDASAPKRSSDELNELLGPIALYPDPLISLVLPASTVPSDIVLADRFVGGGGDPAATDDKPWDSSVKALTHYPDTLKWLDDNLDWTSQVGDAFVSQPVDVMEAIQALRAKAKSLGNLVDTPDEKVVQDDGDIRIVPAQPDSICVPDYDPSVVYVQQATAQPFVSFSPPYVVGPWLGYDFDWRHHHLYHGDWHHGWDYSRGHDRDVFIDSHVKTAQVWHVDTRRREIAVRHPSTAHVAGAPGHVTVVHPKPLVVAPRKGESIRRPEVRGPGGRPEVIKEGKGRVIAPRTVAPGTVREEERKGTPKVREEERKVTPKVREEEHKAAPRREEERKVVPKVREEEHKATPRREEERKVVTPKVREEEHKEAAKPRTEVKRKEEKRDEKKKEQ